MKNYRIKSYNKRTGVIEYSCAMTKESAKKSIKIFKSLYKGVKYTLEKKK